MTWPWKIGLKKRHSLKWLLQIKITGGWIFLHTFHRGYVIVQYMFRAENQFRNADVVFTL
jgi:hypothetical protein